MNQLPLAVLAACAGLGSGAAAAGQAYADVLSATPVYTQVKISEPRQECREEQVVHEQAPQGENAGTVAGALVGGVLGGVVGHQIGGGRGRDVATAVGAVAGAATGHEVVRQNQQPQRYTTSERRCRTVYYDHYERRVDGYDVTYRYRGATYQTHMNHDPGRRLPVKVSVAPAD